MSITEYDCMTPGCERKYLTTNPDFLDLDNKIQCESCSRIADEIEFEILFNKCIDSFPTRKAKVEFLKQELAYTSQFLSNMRFEARGSRMEFQRKLIIKHPLYKFI